MSNERNERTELSPDDLDGVSGGAGRPSGGKPKP